VKRRDLLKAGAVAGAALVLPAERLVSRALADETGIAAFSVPLRVPPVLQPVRRTIDTDYYEITQRPADVEIIPGSTTRLLTYDGEFPGPTIAATQGRPIVVTQNNQLGAPTSVHLHGAFVPPEHDGHPVDAIPSGGARDYRYGNQQRPATLWYHSHAHHIESEQVFRGLAGFYTITDPGDFALGLPSGAQDVPLMLRDLRLDGDNQVVYVPNDFRGRGIILVNGRPQPYFAIAARKYRLRFLNGSNDRGFKLGLSNGGTFYQIASDGGFLPNNVPTTAIELFPGERVEAIVDFAGLPNGSQVVLQNEWGEGAGARQVMRFDVVRQEPDSSRIPDNGQLPQLPAIPPATVVRDLSLRFDAPNGVFLINGRRFDPNRVDFTVKRDVPEIWRITNTDTQFGIPHSMHLHLVQFRVLDRNGVPPGPAEAAWKDTVTVWPGQTVRVQATFTRYIGRYVFHCHLFDHSSSAMMGQIEIIP
jgi:FtsP/CotA-like multicopper oxidase with cupredoxin domain